MIPNEQEQFRKIQQKHQARRILEILINDAFHGRTNDGILGDILHLFAVGGSPQQIRSAIDRLEQMGLVRTQKHDECTVVEITGQGERVASGLESCEGVARFVRD